MNDLLRRQWRAIAVFLAVFFLTGGVYLTLQGFHTTSTTNFAEAYYRLRSSAQLITGSGYEAYRVGNIVVPAYEAPANFWAISDPPQVEFRGFHYLEFAWHPQQINFCWNAEVCCRADSFELAKSRVQQRFISKGFAPAKKNSHTTANIQRQKVLVLAESQQPVDSSAISRVFSEENGIAAFQRNHDLVHEEIDLDRFGPFTGGGSDRFHAGGQCLWNISLPCEVTAPVFSEFLELAPIFRSPHLIPEIAECLKLSPVYRISGRVANPRNRDRLPRTDWSITTDIAIRPALEKTLKELGFVQQADWPGYRMKRYGNVMITQQVTWNRKDDALYIHLITSTLEPNHIRISFQAPQKESSK
jgi:hypothetical protein